MTHVNLKGYCETERGASRVVAIRLNWDSCRVATVSLSSCGINPILNQRLSILEDRAAADLDTLRLRPLQVLLCGFRWVVPLLDGSSVWIGVGSILGTEPLQYLQTSLIPSLFSSFSDVTTGMRVYSFLFYMLFEKVNWCLAKRIGPNLFSLNESINKVFKCVPNRW